MLFITNGDSTEAILESNYEKYEEQNGTALQISFTSFDFEGNVGHSLIDFNVIIEDEDGNLYKVKQINNTGNSKSVIATHIYYDLIGFRKYDQFVGNYSFNQFANWLFDGSGWTFVNEDVIDVLNFNNFGNDNFLQLTQRLITRFNCEMQILPNRVVRFSRTIGANEDKQFRYGSNVETISQNIDTSAVRTRIRAYGANNLTLTYTSPLADNPLFGVLDAEPVTDDKILTESELLEFAISNLRDTPEINIEASVLDTDGNVGDFVWLIHEPLNLEVQVRILSKRTRRYYNESEVEIGNTIKRTIEDSIIQQKTEVDNNREEAQQSVRDLDEKSTAQTEEVRLFVENVEQTLNASISITADQIRSEVNDVNNNLTSYINQTASNIQLQVNDSNNRIASLDIRADQIQSNVTNLENNTNSSITQLSNSIQLKVDVGGSISDINLTQGAATINADKINLNGAVIVNGSISGSSNININNNATIGNAIYFGNSGLYYIDVSSGNVSYNSFGRHVFNGASGVDIYGGLRIIGNTTVNGNRVLTTADLPL